MIRNLTILLLLSLSFTIVLGQYVEDDILIFDCYLDFTGPSTCQSPELTSGGEYYLKVLGTYCGGSCWQGNTADAAYWFNLPVNPGIHEINGHWTWENWPEYCTEDTTDSCEYPHRPTPDEYNENHIYYYPFTSIGGIETIHGIDDTWYGDNNDGLTVQIWQMGAQGNIYGCTDPSACNYDESANMDDGSCEYEVDCAGNCGGTDVELWGECFPIEETTYINFSSDGLVGEIPPEIGDLVNLTSLHLNQNNLSGEIPSEIGQLTNLTYLNLYSNNLTGEIPPEIGNLVNLSTLSLRYNNLSGEIPSEICNLINLHTLDLSYNQLSGEIPPEIGNLVNLTELHLTDNDLSGEIPPVN